MDAFQVFLNTIIATGVIAFAIGQFKTSRNKKDSDNIKGANDIILLLNNRLDVMDKEVAESKLMQQKHHDEIIRLQEQLKHKDQEIKRLLDILRDRNPETEKFMKVVGDAASKSHGYMESTQRMLGEIQIWITNVDKRLASIGSRKSDTNKE